MKAIEDNKLKVADRPAHDWYRFVLSFPPHLVRDYVERFGLTPRHRVLDPFCGTGTTVVECKKLGIPSVGIEANPFARFAAEVKTKWDADPAALSGHALRVAERAAEVLDEDGVGDADLPLFRGPPGQTATLRSLAAETHSLLLKDCISPVPLHKTLVLLDTLAECHDPRYAPYEKLALAKAVVTRISNLHFGPEVGVGRPKADAPVVETWTEGLRGIVSDLRVLAPHAGTEAGVLLGDSRNPSTLLAPGSIDAVITSPPYPNEKDYTRTTRLESVLLGFIRSKQELRTLKYGLVRSNTRGVYKQDEDDRLVRDDAEIQRIAAEIERRRVELKKTSGFEKLYARVTKLYFGGMLRHLADLRKVLRPGAMLAYVVGDQASYLRVMIRTGQLLADIGKRLGYQLVAIDLFRTRLATATKEQLREEVVVFRWPG